MVLLSIIITIILFYYIAKNTTSSNGADAYYEAKYGIPFENKKTININITIKKINQEDKEE